MVQAESDISVAAPGWVRPLVLAAGLLNGFAFVAVNFWIYRARMLFIERNGEVYQKPPTISRAISDPQIGEPFSVWVTASGICLVAGVALLLAYHLWLGRLLVAPSRTIRVMIVTFPPLIISMQAASALGMHWLSSYRFPDFNAEHMTGSYMFFVAQAMVVVLFTAFNGAMLRDRGSLAQLAGQGLLSPLWVRIRYRFGLASLALVAVYLVLFLAKDVWGYPEWPALYIAYVTTEPMVITAFLVLLGLVHVEPLARRG